MSEDDKTCEHVTDPAQQSEGTAMLRLALVSTPRSGNTWTRELLGSLYELEQIPVHHPEEIDWENLPRRCVIQIHWYPKDEFLDSLQRYGVRVAVLARHPLDVLMSWLNYVYYVHQEGYCPGGGECLDCAIVGVHPRSAAFLEWTRSEYARCFLFHSPAWWNRPDVLRIRYEDLVADAQGALERLVPEIGDPPRKSIAEVVDANAIGRKKPGQEVWHFHYWQGQPGLWRSLIPAAEARAIAQSIPEPFETLGYPCDPDEQLEPIAADRNWNRLQLDSTREHLRLERSKHRKTIKDLLEASQNLERIQVELEAKSQEVVPVETVPLVLARRLKRVAQRVCGISSESGA
ncbi:hypothetical protein SAMN05444166_2700 [Singulisphaera sp. GP187]|uniref:sulfotransferase domain-containing protein n=1 Tax=Singulisphaera sp. GP187 TaxID=1882752 RepID=UPI000927235F|nr:sulfotransferase domain-containing protein [Singulisphaera sp. GP187]SIO14739.1 hypothetical protein SAMN05444166_2700 [Singulisphaera sp. GP187]